MNERPPSLHLVPPARDSMPGQARLLPGAAADRRRHRRPPPRRADLCAWAWFIAGLAALVFALVAMVNGG